MKDFLKRRVLCGGLFSLLVFVAGCVPPSGKVDATPNPLDFGDVYVGQTGTDTATWTNNGTTVATIIGISAQANPTFAVSGAFAGQTVNPGGSTAAISYTFSPQAAGKAAGSSKLGVTGAKGSTLTLQGNGVFQKGNSILSVTGGDLVAGQALDFGKVVVGVTKTLKFNVTNADPKKNITLQVKWLAGNQPFSVSAPVGNVVVNAAGTTNVSISFTPPAVASYTDIVEFIDVAGATNFGGTVVKGDGVKG